MSNLYFNRLDEKIRKSFQNLDYKSRNVPLIIDETGCVRFKCNKLLSYVFSKIDIDYLWDDLKAGKITKEDLMDLYRSAGYPLKGFIEIFCEE